MIRIGGVAHPQQQAQARDKEKRAELFFAQAVEVDGGGHEGAHGDGAAEHGHECRGSYREPARGQRAIDTHAGDQAASINHEQAEADQHSSQAETKSKDEKEA
jgi:hypothetical protein